MKPLTDIIDEGTQVKAIRTLVAEGAIASGYVAFIVDGKLHQRAEGYGRHHGECICFVTFRREKYRLPTYVPLLPSVFTLESLNHE